MSSPTPKLVVTFLSIGILGAVALHGQQADAPPVDINQLLKDLQGMATKQETTSKATKLDAYQKVSAAASAADGGATFWQTAIKSTQIDGQGQDANNFRVWKEGEGEIFKEKEVQNAVHLHLEWLAITLQRSMGTSVKDLMPAIQNYARELWADQVTIALIEQELKKEKDAQPPGAGAGGKRAPQVNPLVNKAIKDDAQVERMHEAILYRELTSSVIVKWMRLKEYITSVEGWELTPGSIDGIYKQIIQPELRAERDQRVFEYWDTKMKVGADLASRSKLTFEIDKFNNDTRPNLLWGRAQEYAYLGQKNRAATEMYNVIKSFATHPNAGSWILGLQTLLAPPAPDTTTPGAPATPPPLAPAAALAPAPAIPAPAPAAAIPAPAGTPGSTAGLPGAALPAGTVLPGQ